MLENTIHPGDFLKEELEERGISQSTLAQHIGVEPGVINIICNGRRGFLRQWQKSWRQLSAPPLSSG